MNARLSLCQDIEQMIKSRPVTMGGSLSLSSTSEMITDSTFAGDDFYYYLSGALNTKFFGIIDLPISLAYTNNTLTKNMALPFNRFSLAPTYKGYTVYLGYNSMTFSKYTLSGHDFFGLGAACTSIGKTEISAFYGRMRKAVAPDSMTTPSYKRMGTGLKIGYHGEKIQLLGNIFGAKDYENSIDFADFPDSYIANKKNIASSLEFAIEPVSTLTLSGEYAISVVEEAGERFVYTAFDGAIKYSLDIGSLGLSYQRVPPNYESLGGYYFAEDQETFAIDFASSIIPKTQFSGNMGLRRNNLSNQEVQTEKSLAYSVNLSSNPTEKVSLTLGINNDQQYSNIRTDYQKLVQVNQFDDLDTNLSFMITMAM